jgi:membrane-associated protease RseP (regulator of RpoE activity)
MVNGKEILRTDSHSDTLEPTWPDSPRGNFRVAATDKLRAEMWDANPLNDKPIGVRDIGRPTDDMQMSKQIKVELEGGAELVIAFEPAHAQFGLGLWYELRTSSCYITRMLQGSPAERAGLQKGDEVVRIGGREASGMSVDDIRSAFNAVPMAGLKLELKHEDGSAMEVTLTEGPIYPSFAEFGPTD